MFNDPTLIARHKELSKLSKPVLAKMYVGLTGWVAGQHHPRTWRKDELINGIIEAQTTMKHSHLDDDGGPEVVAIEDSGMPDVGQSLWVRVGPIYSNDEIEDEPGVWIGYQQGHMRTPMKGPVLLTPETWDELDKAVRKRIAKFDKEGYR